MRQDKGIKEQFIITASKLFEEKGYYAVGINEILRELGVNNESTSSRVRNKINSPI